jgi:hypothetical protein
VTNTALPKFYSVNFWQDGCNPVSPGCDNCGCHAPGVIPSHLGHAAARLDKLNKQSFAKGGMPDFVFIQDECDVWSDFVEPSDYQAMVDAISFAQAVDMVISTRYIEAMKHRAPKHWLNGHWPRNLGLMVSVSNQREADRDIPLLLAMKAKHDIPWVGVRLEPLLQEVDLRKLTLQALAHPKKRGRQALDGLTGEIAGVRDPRHVPKTRFGKLDWVTVKGEMGDTARPLHPAWMATLTRDCKLTGTHLYFRGWGEWLPATEVRVDHPIEHDPAKKTESMLMYRHGGTVSDYPDMLMEFYKLGPAAAGGLYRGQYIMEAPRFPRREIRKAA